MRSSRCDASSLAPFGGGNLVRLAAIFFAAVCLGSVGPAACSTTSGIGGELTGAAAGVLLPPSEEEKLGQQFSQKVESELELVDDQEVQNYVQNLGEACVQSAAKEAPDAIDFEFHAVDKPDVQNAFAGPGGQIYMYTGLMRSAENAAEIGAVMCHEVAHVTERHIARRLVTAYGMQALAAAALGDNPGLLARLATSIGSKGFMLKYSRDMEKEADLVGFEFMTGTELAPVGFVSYFEQLIDKGPDVPGFLRSHPSPASRVEYLRAALDAYGDHPGDTLGRDVHQQMLQHLDTPEGQALDWRN